MTWFSDITSFFPEIVNLRSKIVEYCRKTTYTRTMMGRVRRLPNIKSNYDRDVRGAERQAFNTAIQASCADFFKKAAIKCDEFSDEGVKFVFGVFDSFLFEVPVDMPEFRYTEIASYMSDFTRVPQL